MSVAEATLQSTLPLEQLLRPSPNLAKLVLRNRFGQIGALLLVALAVFAFVTPLLATPDATAIDPARKLLSPSFWSSEPAAPLFGTDHLGRDLGVMAALGVRTSFIIAICAVTLSGLVGFVIGGVSGFVGGRVDDLGGRIMDFFSAFPGLLLIIALITALGPSLPNVVLVLVIGTWDSFGRIARASALTLRELPFINAARVSGVSLPRMMATHVRLNTFPLVAVLCVIDLPRMILAEATLAFLGFGLDASQHSLGALIAVERDYLQVSWWAVTFPGVVLSGLCVGMALLGLGLRNTVGVPVKEIL